MRLYAVWGGCDHQHERANKVTQLFWFWSVTWPTPGVWKCSVSLSNTVTCAHWATLTPGTKARHSPGPMQWPVDGDLQLSVCQFHFFIYAKFSNLYHYLVRCKCMYILFWAVESNEASNLRAGSCPTKPLLPSTSAPKSATENHHFWVVSKASPLKQLSLAWAKQEKFPSLNTQSIMVHPKVQLKTIPFEWRAKRAL